MGYAGALIFKCPDLFIPVMYTGSDMSIVVSNIQYNSLHVHKSNVKLHELDVYSQHIVVIYLPM